MITSLAAISCLLALIPATLFLRNLALYRQLPSPGRGTPRISVLIPARNEETNIAAALESVLHSEGVELEIIVLDDGSTDRTAEIVRSFIQDSRVRLESAAPLPPGWCGKNFACHQLAGLARHPLLVFMDADVRVARTDSLARLAQFVDQTGAALVSGVPYEATHTNAEKLIIPLIHFVLLGFLPLERMRACTDPRFAAACGQILAAQSHAYRASGGHAAIPDRIHDAVALTRSFRANGFTTDLFDATDTFRCRMYERAVDVFQGFAKNAHEGLGSRRLIGPATVLLIGGQVLPPLLLFFAWTRSAITLCIIGTMAAYLPRIIGVFRFRQSLSGALLHPLGVAALVGIQWFALLRSSCRLPSKWKGRSYLPSPVS